jgi:hypothetical protein
MQEANGEKFPDFRINYPNLGLLIKHFGSIEEVIKIRVKLSHS